MFDAVCDAAPHAAFVATRLQGDLDRNRVLERFLLVPPGLDRREVMTRLQADIETATARLVAETRAKGG